MVWRLNIEKLIIMITIVEIMMAEVGEEAPLMTGTAKFHVCTFRYRKGVNFRPRLPRSQQM